MSINQNTDDIRQLFEQKLKPALASMESTRKKIRLHRNICALLALVMFLFLFSDYLWLQITIPVLCLIGLGYFGTKIFGRYFHFRKTYKTEVVTKIIQLIDTEYQYDANKSLSLEEFSQSKFYKRKADRVRGDDFVCGRIGRTAFRFSELLAEWKEVRTEDGKTHTYWNEIFKGLMFVVDFNKHIDEETFVFPQKSKIMHGIFKSEKSRDNHYGTLVKLENPEFEKHFKVYGSSQQEARYILTPAMMEAMVNMHKTYKLDLHFSFIGENAYCAIPFEKYLFEPRISKSLINFDDMEFMYRMFGLIRILIDEMNLNTRIWTKQ